MLARSKHNFSGRVITRISKCWEHGGTARSRGASYAPSRVSKPLPVTDLKTPFGCVHQANSLAGLDPVARDRHVDPIRQRIQQFDSNFGILTSRAGGHVKRMIRILKQFECGAAADPFTERSVAAGSRDHHEFLAGTASEFLPRRGASRARRMGARRD